MASFIYSTIGERRQSFFRNTQAEQSPTMGCTYSQPVAKASHHRATSEPISDYYRHKPLPRLPHEIEMYRSQSLPELPSETSRRNNRPLSKYAPEVPLYKNRPLPPLPLRTIEPSKKDDLIVETNRVDSESFFPNWSQILLLKCENVESWEEKLNFAREMQDCWTKRKLFAHEVQNCAYDCACGMS